MRSLVLKGAVGALLIATLSGCILPSRPVANPVPGENRPSESAEPEAPGNPTFGGSHEWNDGLTLTVSVPRPYEPSAGAYVEPAAAFLAFDLTIVNGSDENFDPSLTYITLQSGNTEGTQVFDVENGISGSPMTTVLPGRETTFTVVFGVDDPTDLVMDVSVGFNYRSVIFTS